MKLFNIALIAAAILVTGFLGNELMQRSGKATPVAAIQNTKQPSVARANVAGIESNNVYLEDGVQIIEIRAKGGYSPAQTTAKAYLPTLLRMVTDDTFDCSSSVMIPDLRLRKRLPLSGSTDIQLPTIPENTEITVYCGMGMYSFDLDFVG
jgi:hypothetical protein